MPDKNTQAAQTFTTGRARMRDGIELAYALRGAPQPRARIALVHSLAMDRHFWEPVAAHLPADVAVLLYDCRGHGGSGKPAGPYRIEAFADDLADLLDHAGWDKAVVAGASMGGCVSLAFAAAYPARVQALGLVDTTAWYGLDAPTSWAERADRAAQTGLDSLVAFQTTRWFTDPFRAAHPEIVAANVAVFLRNDIVAYAATCRMLGAVDLRAALPALRMPAAIVVGREDYATPRVMAEALHAALPHSTLTVIEDGRHLTPLEHPARIAAILARLLAA